MGGKVCRRWRRNKQQGHVDCLLNDVANSNFQKSLYASFAMFIITFFSAFFYYYYLLLIKKGIRTSIKMKESKY